MKIFIDLGAYNGDTIKLAMKKYPDFDRYIGFEPAPSLYKKAKRRLKKYSKVKMRMLAASITSSKTAKLFLNYRRGAKGILGSGSTLCGTKTSGNINKKITVTVRTIDFAEYLRDNFSIDDFIVLKVDIEGTEYPLFKHLVTTGAISYVDKIYCEWHYKRIGLSKDKHQEVVDSLKSLGYKITGYSTRDEFNNDR